MTHFCAVTHHFRIADLVTLTQGCSTVSQFVLQICDVLGIFRMHEKYYIRSNMQICNVAQMKFAADVWHGLRVLTQVHYLIVHRTMGEA